MKKLSIKKIKLANMTDLDKSVVKGGAAPGGGGGCTIILICPSWSTPKCAVKSWNTCPVSNGCPPAGTVNGCGTPTGCSECVTCPC